MVKGIRNKIRKITAVGSGIELKYKKIGGAPWVKIPGILWIDVPEEVIDQDCTVIKVELEGEPDLYRESCHE